jgi:uncharacterized membrane protein (UPF0127 family)
MFKNNELPASNAKMPIISIRMNMVCFTGKNNDLLIIKSVLLALFFMSAVPLLSPFTAAPQAVEFSSEPLTIKTAEGATQTFTVELAISENQREHGLMFRRGMQADHGMLFVFEKARNVMMWMENTPLPLDMLFLNASGTITHIHEDAVPYSRAIINSGGQVQYVIELNGGVARKLGLGVGDTVSSATIAKR